MKFEFTVEQNVVHLKGENVLVTKKHLMIDKDEFITGYEADDIQFLSTLREAVCMFHLCGGLISQISDSSMISMYEELKSNEDRKRVVFLVTEKEHLLEGNEYNRNRSVNIDLAYE